MARVDVFSALYSKKISPLDFKWDTMIAPPLLSLISPQDIYSLNQIARSNRLASKPDEKYKMMDAILLQRNFKRLASGTNRVVYKYLEDQSVCLKVAFDRVGLKDNPQEYMNQFKLKPFVTRIFECSPCGTVALVERVEPIVSREEYLHVIDDVFNLIVEKIIGVYVVDDIGTNFFQNIGIRAGFGPVLLDYPYVYELDGSKIYCNRCDPDTHEYCLGEIDYDDGFNYLVCAKCGKQYQARQLAKQIEQKALVIDRKGVTQAMKIRIMRGDDIERTISSEDESNTTAKPVEKKKAGVKILNKNNFDKRQKMIDKKNKEHAKAVEEARERKDKKVLDNINTTVNNLSTLTEEPEPVKEVIINVAEKAAKLDPNYMENSRFPRVDNTKQDESQDKPVMQTKSVREYMTDLYGDNTKIPGGEKEIYPITTVVNVEDEPEDIHEESTTTDIVNEEPQVEDVEDEQQESITETVEEAIHTGEEVLEDEIQQEEPIVEVDVDAEEVYPTKEELDASTWDNPCRVTDVVISYEDYDEVSGMY